MAKMDKKLGMTRKDMQAYKDLDKQLKDPFPTDKVRGPEFSPKHGDHGHVGPVDHIPIKESSAPKEPNAFHEQLIEKGSNEGEHSRHTPQPEPH